MSTINIASHLPARACEQPQTLALIEPHGLGSRRFTSRQLSFRELDLECDALAHGLRAIGITRGMRTALMVPPSLEFYALTFALFKLGAIIVLIDPGMGIRGLSKCLGESAPEAFVGVPKAHLARVVLRWARRSIRLCVTVGRRLCWGGVTLDAVRQQGLGGRLVPKPFSLAKTDAKEQAAILFTSGSTGLAKGAVYTHGIFAEQVEMLKRTYGIAPGEVDLPTFPLFGLFAPALGMTAVIPEMDPTRPANVDPQKIIDSIHYYNVTNTFGSPALLRRVAEFGTSHDVHLPTLRRVISAGAPVPATTLASVQAMLADDVEVHTPYGATEALPVATIGSHEILAETAKLTDTGSGVCVGRPLADVDVRIIAIDDAPIEQWSDELVVPTGTIGEITVRGRIVTHSYHGRPEATRLAKMRNAQTGDIIHRMGDVGYFDEQGRLWFCGRKTHRVMTAERTLFTVPCEAVFNTHADVHRTALVGVQRDGQTKPVVCVERLPEARTRPEEELRRELLALGAQHEHTECIETILFHDAFPVDIRHNAKIFREKLATWAERRA